MRSRLFAPDLLRGQVAVVGGGGADPGRATALELAGLGARVVVCGSERDALEQTAAQSEAVEPRPCDVRDEGEVDALVAEVLERHGRIDTLVNHAGAEPGGAELADVMRLDVEGTWLMTHAVATRAMIGQGRPGKVVNVTVAPYPGAIGPPTTGPVATARAAVENLTRVLSIEWARFDIKLTALSAGAPAPEEIAWLSAFVASPAGDYFSGAVLDLKGR